MGIPIEFPGECPEDGLYCCKRPVERVRCSSDCDSSDCEDEGSPYQPAGTAQNEKRNQIFSWQILKFISLKIFKFFGVFLATLQSFA